MNLVFRYLMLFCMVSAFAKVNAQNVGLYNGSLSAASNSLKGKLTGEVYYLPPRANTNYYIEKEWIKATIELKTGEVFNNVSCRYSNFEDELIYFNDNIKALVKADKEKVSGFTLNYELSGKNRPDVTYVNIDSVSNIVNTNYFECLYRGKVMLLVANRISELKVSPYNDSSGILRDTEFVARKATYIYSPTMGLNRVKFSNHSIANAFPENEKTVLKLLRQNKIRISDGFSAAKALDLIEKAGLTR